MDNKRDPEILEGSMQIPSRLATNMKFLIIRAITLCETMTGRAGTIISNERPRPNWDKFIYYYHFQRYYST